MFINSPPQGVPFLAMIKSQMGSTLRSDIIPVFGMAFSLSRSSHYYQENVPYIVVPAERILFSMRMRRWKARNDLLMITTVLSLRHQRSLVLMVKSSLTAMRNLYGTRKKMCSPLNGGQSGHLTRTRKTIICAPMVVTNVRVTFPGVRRPKTRKWKMLKTMTWLSCTQFCAGRSVIVPRRAQRSAVMRKRKR
jgi:hypothetical protein